MNSNLSFVYYFISMRINKNTILHYMTHTLYM